MIDKTIEVAKEKFGEMLMEHKAGFEAALKNNEKGRLCISPRIEIDVPDNGGPNTLVVGLTYTVEKIKRTVRCKVDEDQGELQFGNGDGNEPGGENEGEEEAPEE